MVAASNCATYGSSIRTSTATALTTTLVPSLVILISNSRLLCSCLYDSAKLSSSEQRAIQLEGSVLLLLLVDDCCSEAGLTSLKPSEVCSACTSAAIAVAAFARLVPSGSSCLMSASSVSADSGLLLVILAL